MIGAGIDVSEWQGSIDWAKVAGAGVDFAVIRVGYGLGHTDRFFVRNWAGAKAVGINRAGYLWFRPDQDPFDQAHLLAASTRNAEMAPWCDFEDLHGVRPDLALLRLAQFLAELETVTTVPTVYTGPAFWRSLGSASLEWAKYPLAIAHYTKAAQPDVPRPWPSWAFWQHSSAGRVPGIPGPVDLDRASLVQLLTPTGHDPKEHPAVHLNAPVVAVVDTPASTGYWEVAADGGIFAFGHAVDMIDLSTNKLPSMKLAAPIVGATGTDNGHGLVLVAADGGVFCIGDARFFGAIPAL